MARRKKSSAPADAVPADAPTIEPPAVGPVDVAPADVPEAPADAPALVESPADPVPAAPPTKKQRKLAQYKALEAEARAAGNTGLASHYHRRYAALLEVH